GERPSLTEYTEKYPELAAEIRDLFPALVMMEDLGSVAGRPALPLAGPLPEQLGDFRILRQIGRGGMGLVYEAVQESLGRHVALKVLPFHALMEPTLLERFRQEARAAARLHHTNIVPVFGIDEHEGIHYYAMQFIQGQNLDEVIHEVKRLRDPHTTAKPEPARSLSGNVAHSLLSGEFQKAAADALPVSLDPKTEPRPDSAHSDAPSDLTTQSEAQYFRSVARVGIQVSDALEYAHRQGVIHRDIKPSNLLLDLYGTVWITDFGLAKAEDSGELTNTGDLVGTIRFMAPERLDGKTDPRSDIYGLGITLYEMLTLQPAFADSKRARLTQRILREEPPRPRLLDPRIPRDLETIVLKATAKEPTSRYPNAEMLAEDLRRFLADRPIRARRSSWAEQAWRWCRRNPSWAAMLGSVAVLLLSIGVGLWVGLVRLHAAVGRAELAERSTQERLYFSLVQQALATSRSRRPGQRFETLAKVAEATRLARAMDWLPDKTFELRTAAISGLSMADLYPGRSYAYPASADGFFDFEETLSRFACTDLQGRCTIRRILDNREVYHLVGPARPPGTHDAPLPVFSDDGRFITILYELGPAQVWRLEGAEPELMLTEKEVWRAYYLPYTQQIAFSHSDGAISIYSLVTGREIQRWPPDLSSNAPRRQMTLAFHPTAPLMAVGSYFAPEVQIRQLDNGGVVRKLDMPSRCSDVAWHPHGQLLAITEGDTGGIHLYEGTTFQHVRTLQGRVGGTKVNFNHTGDRLVANGWGSSLQLYDVASSQLLFQYHGKPPLRTRFDHDDALLAATIEHGRVSLLQVGDGHEYRTLAPVAGEPEYGAAAVHPEGQLLTVVVKQRGASLRGVEFWNVNTGEHLGSLPLLGVSDLCFECNPSGALLTMGTFGSFRWPVRIDPGRTRVVIGPPERLPLPPCHRLSRSRDSRVLVGAARAVGEWQPHAGAWILHTDRSAPAQRLEAKRDLLSAIVDPEGRWVVTENFRWKEAKIWDAADGRLLRDLGAYVAPQFSPNGRWLAVVGKESRLLRAGSWEPGPPLHCVAVFSPDNQLLADIDATHVIRLMEIESGREVARLEEPNLEGPIGRCFTPDGTRLITTTNGSVGGVHVWDLSALRKRLKEMELDWDMPELSPTRKPASQLRLEVLGAEGFSSGARAYNELDQEHPAAAAAELEKAVELLPQFDWAANQLARLYVIGPKSLRNAKRAVALAERAIQLCPCDVTYKSTLGMAYYRAGQWQAARDTLEASRRDSLGWREAVDLYFLAMCFHQLDDPAKAKDCYDRAVKWFEARQTSMPNDWSTELRELRAEADTVMALPKESEP
ncbi:MAG TPA: protein kinase, partial [Gemmataceae bacterium]|nr:protein kinase [Gemmataceae bacterium]